MNDGRVLQPVWDFLRDHLGGFLGSPGFLLTAVVLGIYVPGVLFSSVDVFVTKRQTWRQGLAVYWRAMKWYGTVYFVAGAATGAATGAGAAAAAAWACSSAFDCSWRDTPPATAVAVPATTAVRAAMPRSPGRPPRPIPRRINMWCLLESWVP